MKTLVQRNHFQCGPIALYNAIVLLGVKPPSLKQLTKMCKTTHTRHPTKPSGTYFIDMTRAAQKMDLIWKRSWWKRGMVSIVNYQSSPDTLHIVAVKDGWVYNYWNGKRYVKKCKVKLTVEHRFEVRGKLR